MCEINPAHTRIFRLEAFTSDRSMTAEQFKHEVMERVLAAEQELNADGKFRFHVHDAPSKFWFTVTRSQHSAGPGCIEVSATDASNAREIMFREYGPRWAFQYDDFNLIHEMDRKIIARIQ